MTLVLAAGCGAKSGGADTRRLPTTRPLEVAGKPGPGDGRDPTLAPGRARVTVSCDFDSGWASAFPRGVVDPQRDEFVMQALIGLREDPAFWQSESDYRELAPYAAKRCDAPGGASFEVDAGDVVVLVGQADTFDGRGAYQNNGAVRDLALHAGDAVRERFVKGDLVLDFSCISCPWLEVWDVASASWQRRIEILVDLYDISRAREQRRLLGEVDVRAGRVRLRVAEDDDEVSHLDGLALEIDGRLWRTPLTGVVLRRGDRHEVTVAVALPDGRYPATVIARGYYTPLRPLRTQ